MIHTKASIFNTETTRNTKTHVSTRKAYFTVFFFIENLSPIAWIVNRVEQVFDRVIPSTLGYSTTIYIVTDVFFFSIPFRWGIPCSILHGRKKRCLRGFSPRRRTALRSLSFLSGRSIRLVIVRNTCSARGSYPSLAFSMPSKACAVQAPSEKVLR